MEALENFRLVATEFESMPDDKVEQWIEITKPFVSEKRFGKFYTQALVLLTAHRLKIAGYGNNSLGTVGDSLRVGSYSEGETSISFNVSQSTNLTADADLALTPYGLEYLSIRRLVVVPILSAGEGECLDMID